MAAIPKKELSQSEMNQVRDLFDRCVALPPTARLSLLARETRDKPRVREELESLLGADDVQEHFLDDPIRSGLLKIAKEGFSDSQLIEATGAGNDPSSDMDAFVPQKVGKYQLLERLGVGGMAEVFRAKLEGSSGFQKQFAIKRILPSCGSDTEFISLFEFEANLSSHLTHANIVQVNDFMKSEDAHYLVMEFVSGKNLRQVLDRVIEKNGLLPVDCCVYIVSEICKGLDYAHGRINDRTGEPLHIIHRDISPKNIMLSYLGEVKIVDFGIAKARDRTNVTNIGALRGTLSYMSPEQIGGVPVDHRSDLFSTGAVLYELLAGEPLFPLTQGTLTTLQAIEDCVRPQVALQELETNPDLKRILQRALSRDPKNRWTTANEFHLALQSFLNQNYPPGIQKRLSNVLQLVFADDIKEERARMTMEPAASPRPEPISLLTPPPPSTMLRAARKAQVTVEKPRPVPVIPEEPQPQRSSFRWGVILMILASAAGGYFWVNRPEAVSEKPIEDRVVATEPSAPSEDKAVPENVCQATVESTPPGASFYIRDNYMGKTPGPVYITCEDPVALRVELEGFTPFSTKIVVKKKSGRIRLTLKPIEAGVP